jgi:hypothetical protein
VARDPGSTWRVLPEAPSQGSGNVKTQFIVHSTGTMASAAANFNYFARNDVVVESTFIVGLSPADPTLQILDSSAVADANGSANRRAIAVEVVGDGVGPFTDWQIAELVRLGRWARATHPIPARVIPSEAGPGFGWHVMFGAPGPWTSVRGKVCPGAKRTAQLKATVFPAIFADTPSKPSTSTTTSANTAEQEDDMTPEDRAKLQAVYDMNWEMLHQFGGDYDPTRPVGQKVRWGVLPELGGNSAGSKQGTIVTALGRILSKLGA